MYVLEDKQECWDPKVLLGHRPVDNEVCTFARKADRILCRLTSHTIQEQADFLKQRLGSPVGTFELRFTYLIADKLPHEFVAGNIIVC